MVVVETIDRVNTSSVTLHATVSVTSTREHSVTTSVSGGVSGSYEEQATILFLQLKAQVGAHVEGSRAWSDTTTVTVEHTDGFEVPP